MLTTPNVSFSKEGQRLHDVRPVHEATIARMARFLISLDHPWKNATMQMKSLENPMSMLLRGAILRSMKFPTSATVKRVSCVAGFKEGFAILTLSL
jgi:hypothetical protein